MLLLWYLLFPLSMDVIQLENSKAFPHIWSVEFFENHYYVHNLDGLYLYTLSGGFKGQIIRKGFGPGEIEGAVYLTKSSDGVWLATAHKAIKVNGSKIVDEIKTPGLLCGSDKNYFAYKRISRFHGETYNFLVTNEENAYREYFLKTSNEAKRSGYRINDYFHGMVGEWFAFGEGLKNRCYLANLKTGAVKQLKPNLKGLTLYDLKEHGVMPVRPSPEQGIRFLEQYDSFKGTNNGFFFSYKGTSYLLVFWHVMANKTARINVFDLSGELVTSTNFMEGPHDADDQGHFIFSKLPERDGDDYLLVKKPIKMIIGF